MSAPPTWTPTVGETYRDWVGVEIQSGLVIWDFRIESQNKLVNASVGVDTTIDSSYRSVLINSVDNTSVVYLPLIEEFGVGNSLDVATNYKGFRLRTKGVVAEINDVNCFSGNELIVPEGVNLRLLASNDLGWKAVAWNLKGENIPLVPVVRGETSTDLYGCHNVTLSATNSTVSENAKFVSVTSSSQSHILILPKPRVGREISGYVGATGFSLAAQSNISESVKINNVVCTGSNAEALIPSTTHWKAVCVSSTEWVLTAWTELGAVVTAIVPS